MREILWLTTPSSLPPNIKLVCLLIALEIEIKLAFTHCLYCYIVYNIRPKVDDHLILPSQFLCISLAQSINTWFAQGVSGRTWIACTEPWPQPHWAGMWIMLKPPCLTSGSKLSKALLAEWTQIPIASLQICRRVGVIVLATMNGNRYWVKYISI